MKHITPPSIFRSVMSRLRDIGKIALMLSFVSVALLGCGGGGGTDNGMTDNGPGGMTPLPTLTFVDSEGTIIPTDGTAGGNDNFMIAANIVAGAGQTHVLDSVIDGGDGVIDVFEVNAGAVVSSIVFSDTAPADGAVHLQNIEAITINDGMVNGVIDAREATANVIFSFLGGTVGGSVTGSRQGDSFTLRGGVVSGMIDGGAGRDIFSIGAVGAPATVRDVAFSAADPTNDDVHLQNIEVIQLLFGAVRDVTGSDQGEVFAIGSDIGSDITISGVIDGGGGTDQFRVSSGTTVASIAFSSDDPTGGAVHLLNVEEITINGGTVTGAIDASGVPADATAGVTFNLNSGMVGSVTGSAQVDNFVIGSAIFVIGSGITVTGTIDGGGGADTLTLADGFTPDSANLHTEDSLQGLRLTLSGGDILTFTLTNIENVLDTLPDGLTLTTAAPSDLDNDVLGVLGTDFDDPNTLTIENDIVGVTRTHTLDRVLNAGDDNDTLQLNEGGFVRNISINAAMDTTAPVGGSGDVHLLNFEIITMNGGTVTGAIDASAATAGVTFNLNSGMVGSLTGSDQADTFNLNGGMIGGDVVGGGGDDSFVIGSGFTLSATSTINGGGGTDTLSLSSDFPTLTSANIADGVLTLALTGGDSLTFTLASIENVDITGLTVTAPSLSFPPTATSTDFVINVNIVGDTRTNTLDSVIDGGGGNDRFQLNAEGVVSNISFSDQPPTGGSGDVHLQNVRTIQINGGTVTDGITGSSGQNIFDLQSGTIGGNVIGGDGDDTFQLFSAVRIGGYLDGGEGQQDQLLYNGASNTHQISGTELPGADYSFDPGDPPRGGLAEDDDIRNDMGSVRNIERQFNAGSIDSLSVRNIERLALSPALNLYGALSDALMQFGQQTAEGFALADLNPQTGRLTQLVSKDSPFTKGRIWAHKITHSGNGKGSIGLNLTGLTARAANDYDYQMNLTQHGFDAPVASSQWGDFGLRAVSHTMTGTIETNTAEAQVSGYGAGVSLLWRSRELRSLPRLGRSRELRSLPRHNLTAHITALAGGYEVDAHTSPSNPQAVVNEVSEGSFSAINAVISAGVADKRELANGLVMRTTADVSWQTLSLDDFTETGENGIVVNFDKATRFTARIGAGLESEHWFSDLAFVHETSSGGTLSSGLKQDYRQHDGTAIEMKFGGKIADLAPGLTLKAFMAWRQSVSGLAGEPSAQFELLYRF